MENKTKKPFLERVIGTFSPHTAMLRTKHNKMKAWYESYKGTATTRNQTSFWRPNDSASSADLNDYNLTILRNRSRDLSRNNPLARGALKTVVSNVVGSGLRVQPTIDRDFLRPLFNGDDEKMDAVENSISRLFNNWAGSKDADASRKVNFYQMQAVVEKAYLESGDVFLLRRYKNNGQLLGTCYQMLEGDRVSNPEGENDSSSLVNGIYVDKYQAPTGYSISKKHPGAFDMSDNGGQEWSKYNAYDKNGLKAVLHVFFQDRPEQFRGEPYFAPVIEQFKMLERYTDAELSAAVVSSMFAVFLKTDDAASFASFSSDADSDDNLDASDLMLKEGTVAELGKNQSIETVESKRPNEKFDPFVQAIIRQIGAALEIPFEIMIKHYTASYSAARAAILDAWKFFKSRRSWLISDFCMPAYEAVISEAVANGFLDLPGFLESKQVRAAYLKAMWIGEPMGQIDVLKEVRAARERMDAGITSLAEETAGMTGGDYEKNINQIGKEKTMKEAAGLFSENPDSVIEEEGEN